MKLDIKYLGFFNKEKIMKNLNWINEFLKKELNVK